jgi:hypothetical protein
MKKIIILMFFIVGLNSCDDDGCKESKADVEKWYLEMKEEFKGDEWRLEKLEAQYKDRLNAAC